MRSKSLELLCLQDFNAKSLGISYKLNFVAIYVLIII